MPDFLIISLGCKVNQSESESIAQGLMEKGWRQAGPHDPADVRIINTCTVTGKASMQSRQEIRKALRSGSQVYVTGCYVQTEPEAIRKINGVNGIFGNADKIRLHEIIAAKSFDFHQKREVDHDILAEPMFLPMPLAILTPRTRAFLKIQDGCNACCSYCIVPRARGRSRSLHETEILKRLTVLQDNGFQEIVLTGVHLGRYGLDLAPPSSLVRLLIGVADILTTSRIRLSSLEPNEISPELLSLIAASPVFCKHFHVPLQSGDDEILRQMNRPYRRELFKEKILNIREQIPSAGIGTDVLAGFPGESPHYFDNTLSLIEELPLSYLHVFPFSPRPGTPAAGFPQKIPQPLIKERCARLRNLSRKKNLEFCRRFIDSEIQALVEGPAPDKPNFSKGLTSNYIPVLIEGSHPQNSRINILIRSVTDIGVFGKPI